MKRKHRDPDDDELLYSFFESLRRAAGHFQWEVDPLFGIRARHASYVKRFCPITAIWYVESGKAWSGARAHEAADKMQFGRIATAIVEAADDKPRGALGLRILKTVGVGG